jgi:hypothetical protein
MILPAPSLEQEQLFSEAITKICSLLKENEISEVLPRTLYFHKDRTWSLRFESTGCSIGTASLEQIILEFACYDMGGMNLDHMRIKDQETFDALFDELMVRMRETEEELILATQK